jgi:hypothetical protein
MFIRPALVAGAALLFITGAAPFPANDLPSSSAYPGKFHQELRLFYSPMNGKC